MGAFDTLAASEVPCPSCGDLYWDSCQTKFFAPDYDNQAYLHPGEARPIDFDLAELAIAERWEHEWIRTGETARADGFTLLLSDWDQRTCSCGAFLAPVARFSLAATGPGRGIATLDTFELWDLRDSARVAAIDFTETDWFRVGPFVTNPYPNAEAIAALPRHARREQFAQALAVRIAASASPDADAAHGGWTSVEGPMRCEACQRTRVTSRTFFISHPNEGLFFGDVWNGGTIKPGTRIGPIPPLPADERVRGRFYRLRDPITQELTFLDTRASYGCACGAGRVSTCIRFRRDGDSLVLAELTWRAVKSRADLADIDWVEMRHTGYLQRTDISDDDRFACVLAEFEVRDSAR